MTAKGGGASNPLCRRRRQGKILGGEEKGGVKERILRRTSPTPYAPCKKGQTKMRDVLIGEITKSFPDTW